MSPDEGATNGAARGAAGGGRDGVLTNDPQALEAMIAQRRESLAATIDELVVRAHPKEIARRSAADARLRLHDFAYTPEGALRTERLATVASAAAAVLGLVLLLRSRLARAR